MKITGHCYCGAVRYEAEGEPVFRGQCHCRECQYISGGTPNLVMAMPEAGFRYTQGAPKAFRRKDLPHPVTREFCAECGTHLVSRASALAGTVMLKVGTLDLQSQLEGTENRIAVARKRYIDRVAEYNKMVRYFPTNLTAKFLLHLDEKPNFTVADEKAVAKPPEVKF